ncbi:uncharacterized protein LOC107860416 [Capsicum annuum]|uniref:uncharacterized protein LOC107860416 n=1 Tax=Capsicum annuum TaxID=4072 RepID=UPI0007BF2995|nr:uncharacterized protein LOC107860416 [Capsicum annuum]XP_047263455.1 uncharacterized protein LOC107860416 [Capsicum annuum]
MGLHCINVYTTVENLSIFHSDVLWFVAANLLKVQMMHQHFRESNFSLFIQAPEEVLPWFLDFSYPYQKVSSSMVQLAVECIFCSTCIRFVECCPQEGLTEKLWMGLEKFVFDWLINADRVVSQVEYPSLVDLRGLLLDLVAQLLGALSRIRFSLVTERFFLELNTRRIDTNVARSEALSIINGMHYLKLGVKAEGGLNASASFMAKANPLNRAPHKRKANFIMPYAICYPTS